MTPPVAVRANFASDNTAAAAPEILDAIAEANQGPAASYGADPWSGRLEARFSALFETEVALFPVITGTAANALALAQLVPPFGAVFCHPLAHIHEHQCGAPEFYTGGAKLLLIDGEHAKLDLDRLAAELDGRGKPGDDHCVVPAAISITQATERGTVYRPAELRAIGDIARRHELSLLMDGARFANALITLEASPAELTWRAGIDALALGATKNGALAAEAVIFFDPRRAQAFRFRRKRGGHLLSKARMIAAQLLAMLEDDRWLAWAAHANAMACRLAAGLEGITGARRLHAVEANMVWTTLPAGAAARLEDGGFEIEHWLERGETVSRLVCAWNTRAEDVDRLVATVAAGSPPAPGQSRSPHAQQ